MDNYKELLEWLENVQTAVEPLSEKLEMVDSAGDYFNEVETVINHLMDINDITHMVIRQLLT